MSMPTVVDHLAALIRISSVSSQSNRLVIEYAKQQLQSSGWHTRELTYRDPAGIEKVNLIAAPAKEDLEATDIALAFVCHTDTVPYAAAWQAALQPVEQNGSLHGCGACDVKGFLASLLTAVQDSSSAATLPGARILLTADEEIGCIGAARLLSAMKLRAKQIVIGEPTSLQPAHAGKGYALAEFTVHGREAHSALPANGVSAIYGAARLIAAIEKFAAVLAEEQNSVFSPPFTTINIGTIEGGTAKNIIAGSCTFLVEWRPIPGQDPSHVFNTVDKLAADLAASDATFRYSAKLLRQQLGFETPASSSLVQTIAALCDTPPTSIAFGSEASLLAHVADEVVVFGPGDMRTAHSDREYVPIVELHAAVRCLQSLLAGRSIKTS